MLRCGWAAVAAAIVAGGWSAPASALVLQATYKGTLVDGSTDDTNMFGAGADIGGLAYTLAFVYDTATRGAARTTTRSSQIIGGGSFSGNASPMLSAWMTVNRHTETVIGVYASSVQVYSGLGSQIDHSAMDFTAEGGQQVMRWLDGWAVSALADTFPRRVTTRIDEIALGLPPDLYGGGNFEFSTCTENGTGGCITDTSTIGAFHAETVRIAPVPVPAALPLLASALAGLGLLARPRRRRAA